MRSTVIAAFFLAMVQLGVLAAELRTTGHWTSSVQKTAGEDIKHHQQNFLRQGGATARGREYRGLQAGGISTNMQTLLELHNDARCLHNAASLTYSNDVATSATAHAQVLSSSSCGQLYHSASEDRNGYGENLYMCGTSGSGSCYTPEKAMESLYKSEVQADSVTEYGGHATQILWKSTTELGCAEATCTSDSFNYVYLVCQYNPPGNYLAIVEQEVDLPTGTSC